MSGMLIVALLSLAALVLGIVMVGAARSSPAASAGMTVATVGAVCLGISLLAWVLG